MGLALCLTALLPGLCTADGFLQAGAETVVAVPTPVVPIPGPPPLPSARSYVLYDFDSGQILAAKDPDLALPPASFVKLMTAYLTYQAVDQHILSMTGTVPVGVRAWRAGGSRMFLSPRTEVPVDTLLHGLLIDGANDAAVALAQAVAGTPGTFVGMMNRTAAALELRHTHYVDVDGLNTQGDSSTTLDTARLTADLIRADPAILKITAQHSFRYDHITQRNWNPLLSSDPQVDGIATGMTQRSGYCLDATATFHGRHLIAVVMGAPSWAAVAADGRGLLNYGSHFYHDHTLYQAGQRVGWLRDAALEPDRVPVGPAGTVLVSTPAGQYGLLRARLSLSPSPSAIADGAILGHLTLRLDGQVLRRVPLVALQPARPANLLERWLHEVEFALG